MFLNPFLLYENKQAGEYVLPVIKEGRTDDVMKTLSYT